MSVSGVRLDARWDVMITAVDLNSQLTSLSVGSVRGVYVCVTSSITTVRLSQSFAVTLEGAVSTLDIDLYGSVVTAILLEIDIGMIFNMLNSDVCVITC